MFIVPITILFMAFFIGLAIFLIIYNNKKEKERTQALQATAAQLGWNFAPQAPMNMISSLERFPLFREGHSKQIKNFMYGEAQGIKAAVFDYVYVVGSGKNRHTYFQSVVYLEPPDLNVPNFSLRQEGFMQKVLSAFGYQDIDFGQRPEFSRQYILRGQDEPAIRRTFSDRLLSFYESCPGTCTEAAAGQMFVYRSGYRFQPQEVQSFVGLALQLLNLLRAY
jgi:hypothetical protein